MQGYFTYDDHRVYSFVKSFTPMTRVLGWAEIVQILEMGMIGETGMIGKTGRVE